MKLNEKILKLEELYKEYQKIRNNLYKFTDNLIKTETNYTPIEAYTLAKTELCKELYKKTIEGESKNE